MKQVFLIKYIHATAICLMLGSLNTNAQPASVSDDTTQSCLLINESNFAKRHILYFGWAEDHPKAISLMGGALYPRRPRLLKYDDLAWKYSKNPWQQNSDKPIVFLLSVDNAAPYYPNENAANRRQSIQWSLAEDYLPSPVSRWRKDDIQVTIQHFGRRLLNNSVNAVYSRVTIKNEGKKTHNIALLLNGEEVAYRTFALDKNKWDTRNKHVMQSKKKLIPGQIFAFDFVTGANGTCTKETLIKQGGFDKQFSLFKNEIDAALLKLTYPASLPDKRMTLLWKSSMTDMWNATVKTPVDYEQRGSGGNVFGFYQYDRVFDHDVPDMVNQYILEGYWDVAKQIMKGVTYDNLSNGILKEERYNDAVPKYIMTTATYLQVTGDKFFFDNAILQKIKNCARVLKQMYANEPHGLVRKGNTLDNGNNQLVVDNFALLHGYAAYKYICTQFNETEEAKWADNEMQTLNNNLNAALDSSMKLNDSNWYNACFSFDTNEKLLSGPGNWLGTTLMMSTFPWSASLKGFALGGTWKEHLDASIEEWINQNKKIGNPENSYGAWWAAKYGSGYNAGMALQMLYSDKYRTKVVAGIQWLLDNQSAPFQWGESFYAPATPGDWSKPEIDYETWALGFIRQAMLQICISLKANGDVVLGRGIPDDWLNDSVPITWKNVHFNNGKMGNISFSKKANRIIIDIAGDTIDGNFEVDIPMCKNKIQSASATSGEIISANPDTGKVIATGASRRIEILLQN